MSRVIEMTGECFINEDDVVDYKMSYGLLSPWEIGIEFKGNDSMKKVAIISYDSMLKVKRHKSSRGYVSPDEITHNVAIVVVDNIVILGFDKIQETIMISFDEINEFMYECWNLHMIMKSHYKVPDNIPAGWVA